MKLISSFTRVLQYLPGELSHFIALKGLKIIYKLGVLNFLIKDVSTLNDQSSLNKKIKFNNLSNQLGIAAGLDKNAEYVDCLARLGIGFIEVGTVTPRPQPGNPKPRIFRNRKEKYLINRLGFNNKGVDNLLDNLKKRKSLLPVGISIGKNFVTKNDHASDDYLICMEKVYEYASYVAINISSPNTKDLRDLSNKEYLDTLLKKLKRKQSDLSEDLGYKPLYVKLSPDEELHKLEEICKIILNNNIDGIICCNTTVKHNDKNGQGGLSGSPLTDRATETLTLVRKIVGSDFPLIASGGVMSVADYQQRIEAGADLVQIYTGFIFEGPKLIEDINLTSIQRNT
jgi:dihydroorotate dehydrogenase